MYLSQFMWNELSAEERTGSASELLPSWEGCRVAAGWVSGLSGNPPRRSIPSKEGIERRVAGLRLKL